MNCQLGLDKANHLIVNEQTRNCFEYFITEYGEKDLKQIKHDFKAYILLNYKEPVLGQIIDLWNRYMDYREKLGDLHGHDIRTGLPPFHPAAKGRPLSPVPCAGKCHRQLLSYVIQIRSR